jgi:hypothetical protein
VRLGFKVAPSTVWLLLDRVGIEPAPRRMDQSREALLIE